MGEIWKIAAIVVPMGIDTFGVALALGLAGLGVDSRWRIALLFAVFEAVMPLVGFAVSAPVAGAVGGAADDLAALVLIALGVYALARDEDSEAERLLAFTGRGAPGALLLGLSVSIDELAVGVSAGLLGLPVLVIALAAGVQAFVVTRVGLQLGARLGDVWHEAAERLAGAAFIALGVLLLALNALA